MLGWIIGVALAIIIVIFAGLAFYAAMMARRVEAIVPPIGRFVEVGGAKLHYVDRGDGPAVVMIHGIAANLRHYTATILDEVAKTNRVIAFDRPGCGYSGRPAGTDASTHTQAAIIQEALDKLGIADPLIVGHSLGGSVALAHALAHPGKARGYVLLAPLAVPVTTRSPLVPRQVRSPFLRHLIAWTIGIPMAIKYGRSITAFVFSPQPVPADFAKASGALLGLRPKSIANNLQDAAAASVTAEKIHKRYGEIQAPLICLFGTKDEVLAAESHLPAIEAVPSHEIERLEGIGHMLMHVEPAAVIAAIRKMDGWTAQAAASSAARAS